MRQIGIVYIMKFKNEIILLGTGCAIPNKFRTAPGTLISFREELILLDIGSGITKKIVDHNHKILNLKYLLISHFHGDHTSDLIYLIKANWMYRRKDKLIIIGPVGLKIFYENLMKAYKYLRNKIEFIQIIELENGSSKNFENKLKISAIKVPHSNYSVAYKLEKDDFIIIYSGDTDYCESLISFGMNTDILIHECSLIDKEKRKGHIVPTEIALLIKKMKPKKIILTHFYPICDSHLEEIYQIIKKDYVGELIMGKDDDIIVF